MTIYDVLRRLISLAPLAEIEQRDALKLIDDLEALNALGTLAKRTESQAHTCTPGPIYGNCIYCGKKTQ